MTLCNGCNKEYKVLIDIDGRNMCTGNIEMEIPFCPFCGEDVDYGEGMDDDAELDL